MIQGVPPRSERASRGKKKRVWVIGGKSKEKTEKREEEGDTVYSEGKEGEPVPTLGTSQVTTSTEGTPAAPPTSTIEVDSVEQASRAAYLREKGYSLSASTNGKLALVTDQNVDREQHRKRLKVLPGYNCSSCHIGPECPEFKEGHVCAFRESFKALPMRDAESLLDVLGEVADVNKERMRFGLLTEKIVNGGMPDPNVTRLTEVVMRQGQELLELQRSSEKVSITFSEHGTSAKESAKEGLLSQLFRGMIPEAQKSDVHGQPLAEPPVTAPLPEATELPVLVERSEPDVVEVEGTTITVGRGEDPREAMSL